MKAPPATPPRCESGQDLTRGTTPSSVEDSPTQANGHVNGNAKSEKNKRRNKKLDGKSLMDRVEKFVEASTPPVLRIDKLHAMLQAEGLGDNPTTIPRLTQHLQALKERFVVEGNMVTTMKFAEHNEVKGVLGAIN